MSIRVTAHHAAKIAGVSRRTLHRWVTEGRIARHPDGYDIEQVRAVADSRNLAALLIRAGIPKEHWPKDLDAPSKKDRCA